MDEQLETLMSVTLPQVYALGEKPVDNILEHFLLDVDCLCMAQTKGPDLNQDELEEKLLQIKKAAMTEWIDNCGEKVHRKNQENIAIVADALSSINEMVASKSDNGEDVIVKSIKDSSSLIQQTVTSIDETIQDTLVSIKDQIQVEYDTKQTMLMDSFDPGCFGLKQSPAWSDFAADSSKMLQARAEAYLNGQTAEKTENGEAIKVFLALFMSKFDSIEKSLGQIIVNIEKIQVKQEILKDKQKNLEGLIRKRNEADRPKKLNRRTCVMIIKNNLKQQLPTDKSKEDSLYKLLSRWDKALEKGEKIPVRGYDSAVNNTISYFSDWVRQDFIPYYMLNHKVKGFRRKISNSEAAFNEAARNQYESRQRQSQYGDDNDSD